jgi:hypothetical protein
MSKHTPGPWVTEVIDTINGEPAYWHIVQQNKKGVVGDVQSVNFADAQLIAAAPTLLEALKMALEAPDDDRSWEDYAIAAIKAVDPMWKDPLVN